MKKRLSLALSFAVAFLGLVSAAAPRARAQEVASTGNSITKIREDYERLLAVERDPETPPDVRQVNHNFLAERRAQLAAALRGRIGALRAYQSSLVGTLSADERQAVEKSIGELARELQSLQQQGEASAEARRPARVTSARDGGPIEINSPAEDRTVNTREVELEVVVNDEDVDNIMVAVYTARSGEKPATARTFELKRSERGRKTIPVMLNEGANRIEVSDLKRSGVLATRTLTYVPARDMLNAPQQSAAGSAGTDSPVLQTLRRVAAANADGEAGNNLTVVCGQLQLASLNRTLALVRSTPALGDLAARFRPALDAPGTGLPADPRRRFRDQILMEGRGSTGGAGGAGAARQDEPRDFLVTSQLGDGCVAQDSIAPYDGLQRAAAVDLLRAVLLRLDGNLQPKDIEVNRVALENETEYILETTTSSKAVRDAAAATKNAAARPPLRKSSAFASLSADTIRKQIVLLEEYLGNVEVRLSNDQGVVAQTRTDRDGNFVLAFTADPAKEYTLSTKGDEHFTQQKILNVAAGTRQRVNLDIEDRPVSLLARSLIGYDQSGAAAARREFTYFFDFYISKSFPFRQPINPDFGERLKLWGDFRINSVPQSADATLADFAGSGFTTGLRGLRVRDTARVFEVLGGLEYRLTGNNALLPSFSRDTKQKFALSFIGSYGFVTPVSPLETAPTIFTVFRDAPGLPPAARDREFVAFTLSDRDRFFRQYYGGLRVQTFFFNKHNVPLQRFPAQFDLTIGQNEFVTGGRMRGAVIRMESFFPLPFEGAKFINLFATAQMIPGRANIGTPLILQPAPGTVTVPAANVTLIALPQPNRDHYRIGIGLDALAIIKRLLQPAAPNNSAGNAPPAPASNAAPGGNTGGGAARPGGTP